MESMIIIFGALLADNLLLSHLFGVEAFFTPSRRLSKTAASGGLVTFVTFLSGAISLALYNFVFSPLGMGAIATFLSVLIISGVVCGVNLIVHKTASSSVEKFSLNIPMITTNCVVLGSIMLCVKNSLSYGMSLLYLIFAGLGFTLALIVFGSVRERLELAEPPESFRGLPILLLSASFAAMAFAGFYGLSF